MALSSKNSDLEKQIASIKLECSMSFVSSAVNCSLFPLSFSVAIQVLAFVIVNNQKMCFCQLKLKSVGSFGRFTCLSSSPETTIFKWLFLETVQMNFPNTQLPIELHDMVYTETRSLSSQLHTATAQLDQLRADFETYKRKTRAATLKLQQVATQGKATQAEAELRQQVKALEGTAEELRRSNEALQSQVESLEKARKAAGRRGGASEEQNKTKRA